MPRPRKQALPGACLQRSREAFGCLRDERVLQERAHLAREKQWPELITVENLAIFTVCRVSG